ncbi:T9SS type A sorting domain-containing protein [Terrimonas alba]|uniref:T9SS type A sorting domain-containing protein n=1 Tax=Terrimonas alba TaxID=3349636 RepID=UPI0035F2F772
MLSPLTISGSDFVGCPAPDIPFSVPNLLGCTYTWTHSANILLVSGQNTPTAVFRNISTLQMDAGWVRVTINDSKGRNRTVTATRNVQLVSQTPTPGLITWTWNLPPNRVLLDVEDVPGATSYRWYLDGVLKATTTSSSYQLPMSGNVSCGNFYYFGVRAVGACGVSPESYIGATMFPCDFAYTVSPNPGSDNIRIESNDEVAKLNNKKPAEIQEIELYDKMGVIKHKQKFPKGQAITTISVAALPNDVYTLRIFDGQEWQSCKIVVQH